MEDLIQSFGINGKLIIMQIINFGLLLLLLWHFLYKPVLAMVAKRQKTIEKGIKDAEDAKKKLESADDEKTSIIAEANKDAEEIISKAKKRGEEKGNEALTDAQSKADAVAKNAALKAEEARAKVLRDTEAEIAQTAILAAEKLMLKKLS